MAEPRPARVTIDGQRLLSDLQALRGFGARDPGVVRQSFSDVDMASRRWLQDRMRAAGLEAVIDGVGNVIGTAPGSGPALLMGSHTDTQPEGGWLDGAMGVICALEVARATREQMGDRYAIDVASWMDEEGRFLTCLGSRSFCGSLTDADVDAAVSPEGMRLRDAIASAGLEGAPRARLQPGRHLAYLESHIEQGCVLDRRGLRIGVVSSIVGGAAFRGTIVGEQNHAGTTPMDMRRDAGRGFVELAERIDWAFGVLAEPGTVWTIGDVRFHPGAVNTIPGRCEFSIEFRDVDKGRIDALVDTLHGVVRDLNAKGVVSVELEPLGDIIPPAHMDGRVHSLLSGAGHDAAIFADLVPAGMVFVPSLGGISHAFEEDTRHEDIVLGCQVLADGALAVLNALS